MTPKTLREFSDSMIDALENLGIEYAVGGSFASSLYGEARTTIDIDISIVLPLTEIQRFVDAMVKLGYYTSFDDILDGLIHKQPVNVIDPASGYKADIFLVEPTPLEQSILARKRRMIYDETANRVTWLYSPEDVILYKLKYYLTGESPKHLRDISAMLRIQGSSLDYDYIAHWADDIGATKLWSDLLTDYRDQLS